MEQSSDIALIAKVVAKSAPLLATALGSPIAGMAIGWIASLFEVDSKDTQTLFQKLSTDPDAATKLKVLEIQHSEDIYKSYISDIEDARNREEEIDKETGTRDYVLSFIAIAVVIGYFVMCGIVSFTRLDQSDHDVLYMMLGQLTGGFIMVLSYFFGATNKYPYKS